MSWHILMKDADGQQYTSSARSTRKDALSFACDLVRDGGMEILSIENDRGETIELDEVTLWAETVRLRGTAEGRA